MENVRKEKSVTDILTNLNTNVGPAERFISATAGGALIAYGMKPGGLSGVLLPVVGGLSLIQI